MSIYTIEKDTEFILFRTQKQKGFTLLELVSVAFTVGILMAIVLPSYQEIVQKVQRSDTMSASMDTTHRQEQLMLDNNSYSSDLGDIGMTNPTPAEEHYKLAIEVASIDCPITSCYELTATPEGDLPQSNELKCEIYRLTSMGEKTNDGTLETEC